MASIYISTQDLEVVCYGLSLLVAKERRQIVKNIREGNEDFNARCQSRMGQSLRIKKELGRQAKLQKGTVP